METVFLKLVNMSLTASWLVLAVVLFRIFLKKAPKYIRCVLWGLVGLRLVLPFSLESVFSLIPSTQPLPDTFLYAAAPQVSTGIPALNNLINPVVTESLSPAVGASANPTQILSFACAWIWLIGVIAMTLYTAISYLIIKKKVSASIAVGQNIRLCDHIDTPFILGILKPRIYFPSGLDQETADHVLAHETAHLRRRDHWWKPLGFALLTVYWFNPVMWLAYILLCRDIELACDEKVIQNLDPHRKKAYSQALLSCSVPRRFIAACPLAFGEVGVKGRIKSVLNYKKPAFWLIIAALAVCTVVAVCFLTDPVDDNQDAQINSVTESGEIRLAPGSYVPVECVYMNLLSSYYPHNITSEYRYEAAEQGFFTDSDAFICNVNAENVDWQWKSLLESQKNIEFYIQWRESDWSVQSAPKVEDISGYQKLDGNNHLLLCGDDVYIVHGGPAKNEMELVWGIYRIVPEYHPEKIRYDERLTPEAQQIISESLYRDRVHNYVNMKTGVSYRSFNALDAAICEQILGPNMTDAEVTFESHVILRKDVACSQPIEGQTSPCGEVTVDVLAIVVPGDAVTSGTVDPEVFPVTITFTQYPDGRFLEKNYMQAGFEVPEDSSAYLPAMMQDIYSQAARYYSLDTGAIISDLLDTISSSPAQYSHAGPYIEAHAEEYENLICYGNYTLQYCFREFLYGSPSGIRAEIMAAACRDIASMFGEDISLDGQYVNASTWFDALVKHTETVHAELIAKNEEVKAFRYDMAELNPVLWMLWKIQYPSNEPMDALFAEYLNLDTSKGLLLCLWDTGELGIAFGLLPGADTEPSEVQITALPPATLEEMQLILSLYDLHPEDITIVNRSSSFDVDDDEYEKYLILTDLGIRYDLEAVQKIRNSSFGAE